MAGAMVVAEKVEVTVAAVTAVEMEVVTAAAVTAVEMEVAEMVVGRVAVAMAAAGQVVVTGVATGR